MTLEQDLRALVANHGFEMVHKALHVMMRQDYEFLSTIFKTDTPATVVQAIPAVISAPIPTVTEPVTQTTNQPAKKVMKITVRKAVEDPLSSPVPPPIPPTPSPVLQPEVSVYSENSPVNTLEVPTEKGKFRSPAEMKRFQKEAEMKKRAELDAKGISVASLMTRDNLKKWIEDDGKTYAWVAREMVGCAETQVSTMAKAYGIQSKNSKRKAFITGRL